MKIKVTYFEKFYICRKCGSRDIKIFTKQIGGSQSCYECPDCSRSACNPRLMYKLKDNVDPNEIIRKRNELVENSSSGFTTYSNYLARIIVMGNNLLEGKKPVIKDVKKLEYKHGKLILQK